MHALIQSWLVTVRVSGVSANTYRSYRQIVTRFDQWHGGDLREASRHDATAYLGAMLADGLKANSISKHLMALSLFFRWLVDNDEITANPFAGIRPPRAPEPVTPTLSDKQTAALLATCDGSPLGKRDRAIIRVLLDTGARVAELCAMKVPDVNLEQGVIAVRGKGAGREGPRPRLTVIGAHCSLDLDRHMRERARRSERAELWLNFQGGPLTPNGVRHMLKRRGERAGIAGLHPHMLRHTWASEFKRAGGQDGDLMILGGWRSRQMLDRYGKAEAESRAIEAGRRLSLSDKRRKR